MNTVLWICQGFLAFSFLYSGIMKSTRSRDHLVKIGQTGVDGLPYPLIRFIGLSEIAGAAGIVLPWATGIAPVLTPVTAFCFATIMLLAAPIHYKRKEYKSVLAVNIPVLLISLFVAWGRLAC